MATEIGGLEVVVSADTSQLTSAIQKDAVNAGKKASAGFGKKFAAGMAVAGAAVGVAAVGITKTVVDLGREYEDNMLKMQAVTGATADEMLAAADAAKALGNDTTLPGVSAAGAAEAMLQLGKAGFNVTEAMEAADGAMRLAVSAQMDVGQASEIVANAVGAFGLEAAEATKVSDLLAKGSTSAATTVTELGTGLAQASANFAAAGVPIEDLITSMGLMANAGVKGSDAGTSLKTMLQKLTAPTSEAAEQMKELGVNVFDAEGNLKPMRKLVEDFSKATADMTEEQRAAAITTIFGADASRAANIVLTQGVEAYDELAGSMNNAEGAAGDLAAATSSGLSGAIEAIQSTLETVAIDIYEQIAPSLTTVFEGIGEVVETLSPILSSVGATLGNVAGTILKSLSDAFESLLPAMQPILEIFAKLGEKLGPLIGKVLGKLAEILSEVFVAVGPVIDVLIDLVFEILDAMWPIVEVVVDALLDMVKAFTPLLRAVTTLLPVFVLLINTALKIILPIIEPLLPVFVAFAEIMGDLLVRAIGALMLAFGKFLSVMGDISPFIRDKVVKPTIGFITAWAAKMVEGAVIAFGWVPGLDEKLEGAAKAVENFGKDAEDAVHQAFVETAADANKMGDELAEIGQDLLDNGAASTAYEAGKEVGSAITEGMAIGIKQNMNAPKEAAANLAQGAIYEAKENLQSESPSKVFIQIGEDVVDGFLIGLNKAGVREDVANALTNAFDGALDALENYRAEAQRELDQSVADFENYALQVQAAIVGDAANPALAMQKTKNQQNEVIRAQERLNELRAKAANEKPSDRTAENIRIAENDLAVAQAAAKSFEENFQEGIDLSNAFGAAMQAAAPVIAAQFDMNTPEGQAMYNQIIDNLLAAGPGLGTETALAIAAGMISPESWQSLEDLDVFAGSVGTEIADKSFGQGARMAKDVVDGIDAEMKKAKKKLIRIGERAGEGMVKGLRNKIKDWTQAIQDYVKGTEVTLKIQSPSKVFERIGEMTAAGLNKGFANEVDTNAVPIPGAPTTRPYSVNDQVMAETGTDIYPEVRVFIGDRELTDIVDVQVEKNSLMGRDFAVAGRRDY